MATPTTVYQDDRALGADPGEVGRSGTRSLLGACDKRTGWSCLDGGLAGPLFCPDVYVLMLLWKEAWEKSCLKVNSKSSNLINHHNCLCNFSGYFSSGSTLSFLLTRQHWPGLLFGEPTLLKSGVSKLGLMTVATSCSFISYNSSYQRLCVCECVDVWCVMTYTGRDCVCVMRKYVGKCVCVCADVWCVMKR